MFVLSVGIINPVNREQQRRLRIILIIMHKLAIFLVCIQSAILLKPGDGLSQNSNRTEVIDIVQTLLCR